MIYLDSFIYLMSLAYLAGAEEKGKGKAVDANNPIGPMDELAQQAEKAARERYRSWQRLRLEGLMLLQDVLSSAEGKLKRSCTDNPVKASQLVNLQDDLQQVTLLRRRSHKLFTKLYL